MLTYPAHMKAFLYYYMSPKKPRISGEVRLRVTPKSDAASFKWGSDLLLPNGQPWSRPLLFLPKYYFPLYEKLREEGLVPDDLDRVLSTLPSNILMYNRGRRCLYTFNDTFIVDFSSGFLVLFAITEKGFEMILYYIFWDGRVKHTREPRAYTGEYTRWYRPSLALILIILMNL